MIDPIGIAASGLSAFTTVTDVAAENIATLDDTAAMTGQVVGGESVQLTALPPAGNTPGGGVGVVVARDENGAVVYDPTNPLADVLGYVRMTSLDASQQMGYLIIGQIGVQVNAATVDRAVDAFQSVLQMGATPGAASGGGNSFTG